MGDSEGGYSFMFPEKYRDGVNFLLLLVFLLLFCVSCFLLLYPDAQGNDSIISISKVCAIFSLSGIATVIFSGFFRSIGVFKNEKTVLVGAAAIFATFILILYAGFKNISSEGYESKIEGYESKIEELNGILTFERNTKNDIVKQIAKALGNDSEYKIRIGSVLFTCDRVNAVSSGVWAKSPHFKNSKIVPSGEENKFDFDAFNSNDLESYTINFMDQRGRHLYSLIVNESFVHLDITSKNLQFLCDSSLDNQIGVDL